MIDTRAVGQELQEQLVGAARKGQEQAKKAQEQARKAQEQVRKGQEVVTGVVRTLATTAEALMPQLPTVKLPSPGSTLSRLPGASRLPSADTLRSSAQEIGEQLLAAQRKLTGEVTHAASPLIAQGTAHLSRVARTVGIPGIPAPTATWADSTSHAGRARTHQDTIASTPPASSRTASPFADDAAPSTGAAAATGGRTSTGGHTSTGTPKSTPGQGSTGTRKASTAKAPAAKASTAKVSKAQAPAAKASTAKASPGKPTTDKPGTKPRARKASTQKASTRKNGTDSSKPGKNKD
jgi:ribonuclease R